MGAISTIIEEMISVQREVLSRDDRRETRFAIYYGRLAEMEIKRDPEIMSMFRFNNGPKIMPHQLMGALLQKDTGLPEYAVCIHVNGKPYTIFSLAPPDSP